MMQKTRALIGAFFVLCFLAGSASASGVPGVRAPSASTSGDLAASAPGAGVPQAAMPASPMGGAGQAYVLGTGDRVRLNVYGEEDLSGEYEVSSTGIVALPLIGEIRVAGGTLQSFEEAVRMKLRQGYLNDPKVSAQVVNYRPFFILGEVSKPGSYPYVNGMNVMNAVAMAGGYTYRADKSGVTVVHAGDAEKKEYAISEDASVAPGDILKVPERFF